MAIILEMTIVFAVFGWIFPNFFAVVVLASFRGSGSSQHGLWRLVGSRASQNGAPHAQRREFAPFRFQKKKRRGTWKFLGHFVCWWWRGTKNS